MSDDALHINVVGGSQAEGELKKVAGGYRAIGKAADQAAHSAGNVHGGGGHDGGERARTFSKAFLGGRGGIGGSIGHIGHLGGAAAVAYVAMEAATQLSEVLKRGTEEALENLKYQREVTRDIAEISTKRDEMALRAAEGMDTFDKGREEHQNSYLGKVLQQIEAFERMKQIEEMATRASDASGALSAEKSAYFNPALTAVTKKFQPQKDALDDLAYESKHESKFTQVLDYFDAIRKGDFKNLGNITADDKYKHAAEKFQEQSSDAISKAMAEDKARRETIDAAVKLNGAATALQSAVTRTQSAIPSN